MIKDAMMVIASRLYEKSKLSLGQAAEMTSLSKQAFMEVLGNYGVSVYNYSPADLDRDVNNAQGHTI
jgi:predicted HTH domain antitoxin